MGEGNSLMGHLIAVSGREDERWFDNTRYETIVHHGDNLHLVEMALNLGLRQGCIRKRLKLLRTCSLNIWVPGCFTVKHIKGAILT